MFRLRRKKTLFMYGAPIGVLYFLWVRVRVGLGLVSSIVKNTIKQKSAGFLCGFSGEVDPNSQ